MMSGLLSVIVPVYNMERYLEECVESILNQTYKEIELILVDDGSTDASGAICDKYGERDCRVKAIHKRHEGPIKARLTGVEESDGDYVTFVDADDWIKHNTYEHIMGANEKADIVVSGITIYYDKNNIVNEMPVIDAGLYEKSDIERCIIPYMMWSRRKDHWELNPSLCTKVFKKELLLKYLKKAARLDIHYGEDVAVIYPMILGTQSVLVLHECFYFHRQWREASEIYPYIQKDSDYFTKLYRLYKYLRLEFENSRYREGLLNQLEHFYINAVKLKQQYYSGYREANRDLFPFWKVSQRDRVILYGAGDLGRKYFNQNELYNFCAIVMWTDRNYMELQKQGQDISNPEYIETAEYDKLLIAVKSMELAQEIRNDLIKRGIPKEKIIWSGAKSVELK